MKKNIIFVLAAFILLLPMVFAGCQSGVSAEKYNDLVKDYQGAQETVQNLNERVAQLQAQRELDGGEIQAQKAKIAELEKQIAALEARHELTGATLAETAEKIVKYYHETHVYSAYDLFVCSDMAAEVWNMLKAAGISSIIVVGSIDSAIADILQSNHAWVLAEVEGGKYLALETTGGFAVTASRNPLYYRGWIFDSPADLKSYNDLVKEYNVRVGFRNLLASEVNQAIKLYNNSSTQVEADKYLTLYNKLVELKDAQEDVLNTLMAQINSLAAVIQ